MKRKKISWIGSDLRKFKKIRKLLADVNVVDKETGGQVSGLHQLTKPEEFPAQEDIDNQDDAAEPLYHMPRQADDTSGDKTSELGQGLSQLTTEQQSGKTRQNLTEPGRWSESYHNDNQFEDKDLKLGEPDDQDPLSSPVYPPYTDGIGQPSPRYEDASPKQRNIVVHAQETQEIDPNKGPRYFWIAVDLDGTILDPPAQGIYQDQSGKHLFGPPIQGAKEALQELMDSGARVSIYSARQYFAQTKEQQRDLIEAIENELVLHDIPFTDVYVGPKCPANNYVDDKAIAFKGDWDLILDALRNKLHRHAQEDFGIHDIELIYETFYKFTRLEDRRTESGLSERGEATTQELKQLLTSLLRKAIEFLREGVYKRWLDTKGPEAVDRNTVTNIENMAKLLVASGDPYRDLAIFSRALNIVHQTGPMAELVERWYGISALALEGLSLGHGYTERWDREIAKVAANLDKVRIVEVTGEDIRNLYDVDFVMGGHHYRYDFIPEDEIWIDEALDTESDKISTIIHELLERYLMRDMGMPYEEAHEVSNTIEDSTRAKLSGLVHQKLAKDDPVKQQKNYHGIKIDIEWPQGSIRSYKGQDTYVTLMKCDYGYVRGVKGTDQDSLDVYLGDDDSDTAYIIEQLKEDGTYDEDKTMLGFKSEQDAVDMYLKHLPAYMLGDVRAVPIDKLVTALYGEPEDRRGQDDLVPSEELKKLGFNLDRAIHNLRERHSESIDPNISDQEWLRSQNMCGCGHTREYHDGIGCFADPEKCSCDRQPGMFSGEKDEITRTAPKQVITKIEKVEKKIDICPYCNREIHEKSMYYNDGKWYHRGCVDKGPIVFPKTKEDEERLQQFEEWLNTKKIKPPDSGVTATVWPSDPEDENLNIDPDETRENRDIPRPSSTETMKYRNP